MAKRPIRRQHLRPKAVIARVRPLDAFRLDTGPKRKRLLIFCEGTKTEPLYFAGFPNAGEFEIVPIGKNTRTLIDEVLKQRAEMEARHGHFDQVWCVLDRDSFPARDFNAVFEIARKNRIYIAYSNEAFELWYLLHFDYHTSAISRDLYSAKLSEKLPAPYRKNSPDLYGVLKERQAIAINHAHQLLREHEKKVGASIDLSLPIPCAIPGLNPESDNPSTTVHFLVEELNKDSRA